MPADETFILQTASLLFLECLSLIYFLMQILLGCLLFVCGLFYHSLPLVWIVSTETVVSTECILLSIFIRTLSLQRSKAILGALVKVASKTPVSKSFQLHRTDDKMKNCTGNKTKLTRERPQQKHCHFSKVPSYILICEHKLQCFDAHVVQLFSSDMQLLDTSMDPLPSSHRNFKGFWRILFTKRTGDRNWV